ncbi:MAG: sugar transferase [Luteitalea sp.]|nr:sugar transferase [Luteitalea sp.]
MRESRSRGAQLVVKHGFDRVLALIALIPLSPLFAVIAVLIKTEDRGPVLFVAERAGAGGRPFRVYKFRSMIPDADAYLDNDGRPVKPRVTRIGRFLRRWSLDELPQLINVLKGEMTLVGPRPVPLDYAARMNPSQQQRFEMRPGITGLAQVRGRHSLTWSQRVELDVHYVRHYSLAMDLGILARTLTTVLDSSTLIERGDPRKVDLG